MEDDECICFWNPSTNEYKRIPPPPSPAGYAVIPLYGYESYGFGYDCANDDYKLVRLLFEINTAVVNNSEAQVYTLRTNSWKRIGKAPCRHPLYGKTGVYLDGCLHWIGDYRTNNIDCFHLNNDQGFEELLLPRDFDRYIMFKELSVLKGCLCLVGNRSIAHSDVWVMTEYGVRESWTKISTINHDRADYCLYKSRVLMPCNNGDHILSQSKVTSIRETTDGRIKSGHTLLSCFVLHGRKKEGVNCRNITVTKGMIPTCFEADTLLETFVSLKSGTYLTGDYKQRHRIT